MERIRKAIEKARHERHGANPDNVARRAEKKPAVRRPAARDEMAERWAAIAPFSPDIVTARRERIVTIDQDDRANLVFDKLRTKLLSILRQNHWTSIGITSATTECGKTVLSANLAFSFARQPELRTILVDLDMRRPSLARLLKVDTGHSVASVMVGKTEWQDNLVRYGANLAIATNTQAVKASAELLQTKRAAYAFSQLKEQYQPDVILVDLPPMMSTDDVMSFLPNLDCMLLVAAAGDSTVDQIDECEHQLAEQSNVAGVILNKFRYGGDEETYYY